jgi:hypothetical protein
LTIPLQTKRQKRRTNENIRIATDSPFTMYVYVGMGWADVCMYVCMYVCMHACMYVCM